MDTQTQIDRLIELAIIQRSELKQLVEQLPQLREHLNSEVEKVFDETEPQLRAELEEWTTKQTADKTAALGVALEAKIADLAKSLEVSTQARYNAIIAEREENARLAAQAEAKIAEHAASLPGAVKEIVTAELARFPRAGEIDQLRKEFAEPRGLNPRGKWQAGESYSKLDFVTINGDSYASNIDNNRTRPSRSSADWTLVAARGTGGGGGPTSLSELTTVPSDGDVLIGSGTSWVTSNLTAGAGISITVGPGAITISATDGDITLDDGTAASPSLHFTNDPDTGIYRPAANTLGISVSGTQVAYFDENGLTVPSAGVVAGGSFHGANGNANNPSYSFSGDQDTGFFRHQPNEIGIALGGTQYATLTSTTFSITPVVTMASSLQVNGTTDSSSKDTGAIVTEGGLGVEKSATIGGNLTVNGGTIGTAASTNLTLQGGSSGASLVLGQGTSGAALVGLTSALAASTGVIPGFQVALGGSNTAPGTALMQRALNDSAGSAIYFTKTRSTTAGTYTSAIQDGDTIGAILAEGADGVSALRRAGSIFIQASGLFSATSSPGRIVFNTTPSGSTSTSERARINENGNFLLGTTTDGGQKLQVAGGARFNFATNTNITLSGSGTISTIASLNDAGNAYQPLFVSGSVLTFNIGGSESARFAATTGNLLLGTTTDSGNGKLQLATHTTSAGGIGFGTDVSLYRPSAGNLALSNSTAGAGFSVINSTNGGQITAQSAGTPMFVLTDTTQALNEKIWGIRASSGSFIIGAWTDSYSAISNAIKIDRSAGTPSLVTITPNLSVSGSIAIGNTVQTAVAVASTHKVTISIGGSTYYLLATNV